MSSDSMNSIKTLEAHNAHRRGEADGINCPAYITRAIDDCVQAAKRYEVVRTMNRADLNRLSLRMWMGEDFDEIIDELIEARTK